MILVTLLGFLSAFVIGIVLALLWQGFLIMTIWNWFMPVLFGLPFLNWWQALALSCVTGVFRLKQPSKGELEADAQADRKYGLIGSFAYFIGGALLLLMAYIIHCNM